VAFCRIESLIQFDKRRQLFIRTHNETLSVAVMRVCNPHRSLLRIDG
jgi:hypothetical protein